METIWISQSFLHFSGGTEQQLALLTTNSKLPFSASTVIITTIIIVIVFHCAGLDAKVNVFILIE